MTSVSEKFIMGQVSTWILFDKENWKHCATNSWPC